MRCVVGHGVWKSRRPAFAFAAARRRSRQPVEIVDAHAAAIMRFVQQSKQHAGCRERIAAGAMAGVVFNSVIGRDRIEVAPAESWQQPLREPHGTQGPSLEFPLRHALDFRGNEAPIESGIVRDEHMAFEDAEQLIADLGEAWRVPDHRRRDVRERRDHRRNRPLGIDQRVEYRGGGAVTHEHDRDFGDAVAGAGARSRRLDVDDDKRFVPQSASGDDGPRCGH